ncbi:hypothetical protein PQO03_08590 [Lentisphaera profundi]|uniref:Right-handed parallel beta-helix repeat-containing protein n=1 Tax=Lentisphaera profundi TaxID=1658616 RepID=A0ABY7VSE4_9BACT|nr:hypothetical protein [Lentisphaera profundi]WDE95771.1 hypothetical protein PQO03_08590 [Lentisphaera profundi]
MNYKTKNKIYSIVLSFFIISFVHAQEKVESKKSLNKDTVYEQLIIAAGASLTVGEDVKLTLHSTSSIAGQLILKPGAQIEIDGSQESKINILSGGLLKIEGTKQKPCVIYAKEGSPVAYISDGNSNGGGRVVAKNAIFKGLGGAPTYRAYEYSINANSGAIDLEDCVFDKCFQVKHKTRLPADAELNFLRCKWQHSQVKPKSERKKYELWYIHETKASAGSKATIVNCDFDKTLGFFYAENYVVEGNVFREGIQCYPHMCPPWKSFKGNFIRSLQDGTEFAIPFGRIIEDCVFIKDTGSWNPHYIGVSTGQGKGGIYGSLFWFTGGKNGGDEKNRGFEGDGVMVGHAKSGSAEDNLFTVERNIVLPNIYGPYKKNNLSTTLITILHKSNNSSVEVKSNTIFTTNIGGLNLGETNVCGLGRIKDISSNLFIGNDSGYKINNMSHTVIDSVTDENVSYNASWRISLGSNHSAETGKGYNRLKFSGTPTIGANDIDDVDPQFVDVNRNPYSWAVTLGGKASMNSLMDNLSCKKEVQVYQLLGYIREGMRPQNSKLKAAGNPSDGSPDMGAVKMDKKTSSARVNI